MNMGGMKEVLNSVRSSATCVLLLLLGGMSLAQRTDTNFLVNNTAMSPRTTGGMRFDLEIRNHFARMTLQAAKDFIVGALNMTIEHRIDLVTLYVDNITQTNAAYTTGNGLPFQIDMHLSSNYVDAFAPEDPAALKYEITGVLYHESAHIWQNRNGAFGTDPVFTGVVEGIADFMRLRSEHPGASWVKQPGGKWYDGNATTAFFFDWIDSTQAPGFVNQLNYKMANPWDISFFQDITGNLTVDSLWNMYQAQLKDG